MVITGTNDLVRLSFLVVSILQFIMPVVAYFVLDSFGWHAYKVTLITLIALITLNNHPFYTNPDNLRVN